ncbi:uncharacterized protein LOC141849432 [Brevipalpus obovatus]|uniref:uncharacterized protein LOC141849432 n=1 Tax=Brevipalpus obovatus TaxID=246614 RepID=UPI003D9E1D8C
MMSSYYDTNDISMSDEEESSETDYDSNESTPDDNSSISSDGYETFRDYAQDKMIAEKLRHDPKAIKIFNGAIEKAFDFSFVHIGLPLDQNVDTNNHQHNQSNCPPKSGISELLNPSVIRHKDGREEAVDLHIHIDRHRVPDKLERFIGGHYFLAKTRRDQLISSSSDTQMVEGRPYSHHRPVVSIIIHFGILGRVVDYLCDTCVFTRYQQEVYCKCSSARNQRKEKYPDSTCILLINLENYIVARTFDTEEFIQCSEELKQMLSLLSYPCGFVRKYYRKNIVHKDLMEFCTLLVKMNRKRYRRGPLYVRDGVSDGVLSSIGKCLTLIEQTRKEMLNEVDDHDD